MTHVIRLGTPADRDAIYRLRHEVYACELGQHAANLDQRLTDPLDAFNVYVVATLDQAIAGFVSITPPGSPSYSIDKYLQRGDFPDLLDTGLHEVRLLTVGSSHRGREIACLLMYAALRWVEAHGGERIVAIGRTEVLSLYLQVGLGPLGRSIRSGAVTYELLTATTSQLHARIAGFPRVLERMERSTDWQLGFPFARAAACVHGGAFFDAIGSDLDRLERRHEVINADVLDAWFPPSPKVVAALQEHLAWLVQTSPPTGCDGMLRAIARERQVPVECLLPSSGSSAAIFLALRDWLTASSRVLLLDPSYGEYAHVLERVVRCHVDRFVLRRVDDYRVDLDAWVRSACAGYDLVVLVNPNSPTGRHVPRVELESALRRIPAATRVWVDEAYVEYAGPNESLERFAAASENVFVCKSMSKVYALSGARAAYVCGPPGELRRLRSITPPWSVSLLAQVAVTAALQDPTYYAARYAQTRVLRDQFAQRLSETTDWSIVPATANFFLCHLPADGPDAAMLSSRCRAHGLFIRDASEMGSGFGARAVRIAVKDSASNDRIVEILERVVRES